MNHDEPTLAGPFALDRSTVASMVEPGFPGVYLLGRQTAPETTTPEYVGRDDKDVQRRLLEWASEGPSPHFVFKYCESAEEAYREECRLYHLLNPVRNKNHPACPDGLPLTCAHCPPGA